MKLLCETVNVHFCGRTSNTCKNKMLCLLAVGAMIAIYVLQRVNLRPFTKEQWYNISTVFPRLYAYSAFYDDRPSLLSDPVIRIIAISDPYEDMKRTFNKFYCRLNSITQQMVVNMTEEPMPIGFGWPLDKKKAREYIYTCPTVRGIIPESVSIATTLDEHRHLGVPVTLPDKTKEQRDFCVCVQAAYGTLDPFRLIEWMELQKILGVSLVGIHILSASDAVTKVFRHYSDEGFVDLRTMNYIFADKNNDFEKEFWLHLTPAINDCIYRHMYECRRVVVIDFDEFIMPRKHQNLSDLMTYLDRTFAEKKSLRVNFAFRNNYFFLDIPQDEAMANYSTFLQFRKRVKVSPEGYSVKSIINPQACTHMHNHYCWGVTANYSKYGDTGSVDPEIALNQHYKKCHFSKKECDELMSNVTQDDTLLRFKERLHKNVREKVLSIFHVPLT